MADGTRWGFALMLACPACAGGFLVAVGAVFGITAAMFKGALLAAVLVLLAGMWLRGYLLRRADECDACPPAPARSVGSGSVGSAAASDD